MGLVREREKIQGIQEQNKQSRNKHKKTRANNYIEPQLIGQIVNIQRKTIKKSEKILFRCYSDNNYHSCSNLHGNSS